MYCILDRNWNTKRFFTKTHPCMVHHLSCTLYSWYARTRGNEIAFWMTIDSRTLPGRRSDAAQVVGLRPPSEGARMEVRLVHAAALERAPPCVERGHPAGVSHPSRGELIRLIAYLWLATLYGDLLQCVSFGQTDRSVSIEFKNDFLLWNFFFLILWY